MRASTRTGAPMPTWTPWTARLRSRPSAAGARGTTPPRPSIANAPIPEVAEHPWAWSAIPQASPRTARPAARPWACHGPGEPPWARGWTWVSIFGWTWISSSDGPAGCWRALETNRIWNIVGREARFQGYRNGRAEALFDVSAPDGPSRKYRALTTTLQRPAGAATVSLAHTFSRTRVPLHPLPGLVIVDDDGGRHFVHLQSIFEPGRLCLNRVRSPSMPRENGRCRCSHDMITGYQPFRVPGGRPRSGRYRCVSEHDAEATIHQRAELAVARVAARADPRRGRPVLRGRAEHPPQR